jgi:hypothetical protein
MVLNNPALGTMVLNNPALGEMALTTIRQLGKWR